MSTTSAPRYRPTYPAQQPPALPQALLAIAGGMALFVILLVGVAIAFDVKYAGQIYPGVSVAGLDLSGRTPEQALGLITQRFSFTETGKIVFRDGSQTWVVKPSEIGLRLDTATTTQAAYSLGRSGNPLYRLFARFSAWYAGIDLPPLMVYDENQAQHVVGTIAQLIDRPTIEASLTMDGLNVVAQPGQVGRKVNVAATLAPLVEHAGSLMDVLIDVAVDESPPSILDASAQAETARRILSAPLILQTPEAKEGDPGPWTIEPERLAKMLTIERVQDGDKADIAVRLETEALRTFVEALVPKLARTPANARFIFNDETQQLELIQPAVIGRSLDVEGSLAAIQEKLSTGEHNVPLTLTITQPEVGDSATAEQLGIRELVSAQTTYFYGSSESRIQNIEIASSRFHGVLVPPGATFSMAQTLGDVSLDNGYAEALIIYGDRTIQGVGGGVCQVSTTLFRTVFSAGFPVLERYPHAYRVVYYELNAANQIDSRMAGLDATVFVPMVDFKFKNDTPNWLLMETYVNVRARTLTWKFYSTSDGRTVDWDTTGLRNTVSPDEPVYQENPDLDQGQIKQVDWAVDGADVTVTRVVYRDGQVYLEDSFSTHYLPWKAVYEYGPGTDIPQDGVEFKDKKKKKDG